MEFPRFQKLFHVLYMRRVKMGFKIREDAAITIGKTCLITLFFSKSQNCCRKQQISSRQDVAIFRLYLKLDYIRKFGKEDRSMSLLSENYGETFRPFHKKEARP